MKCGIIKINQEKNIISIHPTAVDFGVWAELGNLFKGKLKVVMSSSPFINLKVDEKERITDTLTSLFENYLRISTEAEEDGE